MIVENDIHKWQLKKDYSRIWLLKTIPDVIVSIFFPIPLFNVMFHHLCCLESKLRGISNLLCNLATITARFCSRQIRGKCCSKWQSSRMELLLWFSLSSECFHLLASSLLLLHLIIFYINSYKSRYSGVPNLMTSAHQMAKHKFHSA